VACAIEVRSRIPSVNLGADAASGVHYSILSFAFAPATVCHCIFEGVPRASAGLPHTTLNRAPRRYQRDYCRNSILVLSCCGPGFLALEHSPQESR
jgi:hypothetical protein